jgi:hypothetical protein
MPSGYGSNLSQVRRPEFEAMIREIGPPRRNQVILELGAGDRSFEGIMNALGYQIIALDGERVRLPLADHSVDVILMWNAISPTGEPHPLSREFNRVLKKSGYCLQVLPETTGEAASAAAGGSLGV